MSKIYRQIKKYTHLNSYNNLARAKLGCIVILFVRKTLFVHK